MARVKFPKIVGINQLADETSLAEEEAMFVREATNVDIDSKGNVSRRKGATLKLSGSGYHSLYMSDRGWLMMCHKNELGAYFPVANVFDPLVTMEDSYLVSYTESNGNLYAMSPSFSCMFLPGSTAAKSIGVPLPSVTAEFGVLNSGGFEEGKYGVAYTIVDPDGEESGLSKVVFLDIPAGGGIQGILFTIMSGYKYRVYVTTANGEELHQAIEFDADVTTIQILAPETGRLAETFGLQPLPFGHIIRAFGARLLVGSVDVVYFSEAFRSHLADPTGFVPATGSVTMIECVNEGAFIGDNYGVRFYKGDDPSNWQVSDGATERAIFGTSLVVSGSFFGGDLAGEDKVAIWLTESGYQVGLATGKVMKLNAGQVKLPSYTQGCAATLISDGRKQLITPVNSNQLAGASVALDSVTI